MKHTDFGCEFVDPSASLRAKTAFLLGSLVIQADDSTAIISSMRASAIISTLITSFTSASLPTGPNGDVDTMNGDYKEKALRVLVNIADAWGFDDAERKSVLDVATTLESDGLNLEECGLAVQEWRNFKASLSSSTRPPARAPVSTGPTDAYGLTPGAPDGREAWPVLNPLTGSHVVNSAGTMLVDHTPPGFTGRSSTTAAAPFQYAAREDRSLLFLSTGAPLLERVPAPQVRLATNNLDSSLLSSSIGLAVLENVPDDSQEAPAANRRRATIPRFSDEGIPMNSVGGIIFREESDDDEEDSIAP